MSETPIRDCERWIANRIWIDDGLEILEQYSSDGTNWIADAGNLSVAKRIIAEHNTLRGIPTESLNDQFWRAVELCARHANWCRNEAVGEASDLLTKLCRDRKAAIGTAIEPRKE